MDRSLQGLSRRTRVFVVVLIVALLAGVLVAIVPSSPAPGPVAPPTQFTSTWWIVNLGGDTPFNAAKAADLNDLSKSDLPISSATSAAALAKSVATAQVTGQGRDAYPTYFPTGSASATCTSIDVLAAAPLALPVQTTPGGPIDRVSWSKTAVAYHATCSGASAAGPNDLQVLYVYAHWNGTTWVPVASYLVPGGTSVDPVASPVPPSYAMKHFTSCGAASNTQFQALIIVVDAFELMCAQAAKDGQHLQIASAFRTPAQQAALFAKAVQVYGSAAVAAQWVEPATANSCSSKHCSGVAIDLVSTNSSALDYVRATVGCVSGSLLTLGATTCPSGSTAVLRLQRYGFIAPYPQIPTYMEYALPTEAPSANNLCTPSDSLPVPQIIASVWRCRLLAAGVSTSVTQTQVSSALVVSRCESQWNPAAKAYGGQWARSPDPADGKTYTNTGLFMLDNSQAVQYVPGGVGALTDPVANSNGAASLWLATRSWASYGCATGHGSFDTGPVLPEYGGPPLPAWSRAF